VKPGEQTVGSKNICKFYLTGNCHRGKDCSFNHNLKDYPCKYLHGTGYCDKGEKCRFSHERMKDDEIPKFIEENEDFLMETFKNTGKTNFGHFFTLHLNKK
jgi:hypothetical protein